MMWLGYSIDIWYAILGLGVVLLAFVIPSALSLRFNKQFDSKVSVFSGIAGVVFVTVFGLFPYWVLFVFAIMIIYYLVNEYKRSG